jgi:hypothetical protein
MFGLNAWYAFDAKAKRNYWWDSGTLPWHQILGFNFGGYPEYKRK